MSNKLTFEQIIAEAKLDRDAIDSVFEHTIRLMKANRLGSKSRQLDLARKRLQFFFDENVSLETLLESNDSEQVEDAPEGFN